MQGIPYDASHVPIDYDDSSNVEEIGIKNALKRKKVRRERREKRAALEKDIAQLQRKLMVEVNTRNALNRGLSRPLGSLPRMYGSLPVETRELLLEVAVLEEEIVSLEKQVVHLGREIETEAPPTDKETTLHKILSPVKTGVVGSPLLSPKASARINAKPLASPRKSPERKSNLSKPSLSSGKFTENKSSLSKVTMSPRNSLDKPPVARKDSSKSTPVTTIGASQKSQIQRNSLHPKVPVRNSRDSKSRRLSFTREESNGVMNTVPFIPKNLKEGKESTPSVSPASRGSSDAEKGLSGKPLRTENGKQAPLRRKDQTNSKCAPAARTQKAPGAIRPSGQEKDPVDLGRRTPRLPRQPEKPGFASIRRTVRPSTASRKKGMEKNPASKVRTTPDAICDLSEPQKHVEDCFDLLGGDRLSAQDQAKACQPEADTKDSLEQVTDSVLLSEEVVKLLETIYENMQEKQPPLPCDSGSSSQASMSTSASPDDYGTKGGSNTKFRLDGCHTESLRVERSASMRFMRDVADTIDKFSYLSRGNISDRMDYHERLMS